LGTDIVHNYRSPCQGVLSSRDWAKCAKWKCICVIWICAIQKTYKSQLFNNLAMLIP